MVRPGSERARENNTCRNILFVWMFEGGLRRLTAGSSLALEPLVAALNIDN